MLRKLFQTPFFSRFDPKGKSKQYQNRLTVITAILLFVFTVAMGCYALYFAADCNDMSLFRHYFHQPFLVILNVLPYILIAFLVWFLLGRAWAGFFSASVLCAAYSFTEYWKLAIRSDPFFAEDLGLFSEAVQISEGYLFFDRPMVLFLVGIFLFTLLLFLFCRGKIFDSRWRWILSAVVLISCIPFYFGVYVSDDLYKRFPAQDSMDEWIEKEAYVARGGTYPFLHSIQDAFIAPPENYNKKAASAILSSYPENNIPEDQKVNVIFVMYEAYSDLSQELEGKIKGDPYAYFHQLQRESYSGELITNAYGGGTVLSERGVMTGFSDISYRYRRPCWSYVQYFSDNGYVTEGCHGGNETFYNRKNINENLGFDQYYFIENHFAELTDWYPMDDIFLSEVTRLSKEQMDAGNDLFSFHVTFQNHGPYAAELEEGYREYVSSKDLSDADYGIINNYLNGIADTNVHMKNMVDSFRFYDKPVVLVFFGDHKPSLGNNGDTYNALGIPVFGTDEESFYNTYQTEYLIWANNAAKTKLDQKFTGAGPTISPCFLMNLLFEQCGWEGPSYMKLTDEVMQEVSVISYHNRYLVGDELVMGENLTEECNSLLNKMDITQFYLAHDVNLE